MSPLQKFGLGGVLLLGLFLVVKPFFGPASYNGSSAKFEAPSDSDRKAVEQNLSSAADDETRRASTPTADFSTKTGALARIQEAGHACSEVTNVKDAGDSVSATCSDGETYRVADMMIDGKSTPIAMKCSAVRELGIAGC